MQEKQTLAYKSCFLTPHTFQMETGASTWACVGFYLEDLGVLDRGWPWLVSLFLGVPWPGLGCPRGSGASLGPPGLRGLTGSGEVPPACDAMFCTNTEFCKPVCVSLAVSFEPRLVFWGDLGGSGWGGRRRDPRAGGLRHRGGNFYGSGRRFAAALSGLKPQRGEGGRAELPERPGADAENQQERGPGSPVAHQPGFPALPAVLLQVLPVAEGERGERAARPRFPAERREGRAVIPPPEFPGAARSAGRAGWGGHGAEGGVLRWGTVGFGFPGWYPSHCVSQGRPIPPAGNDVPGQL